MRLKSFHASSMSEALRQVKETLGDEAIIVSSKEEPSGWVRITAAVEQINPPPEPAAGGFDDDAIVEAVTDTLLKHRVPAAVSEKIILAAMMTVSGENPKTALTRALQKCFVFISPEERRKKNLPIVLIGPPGAGKTLMASKLAARAVLENKKAAVITTDTNRAGGIQQLEAFLDILGLPLQQAENAKTLKHEIAKVRHTDQIIIDTGGLNPFDQDELKDLARLTAVEEVETALVMPAGIDAEESAEMAAAFSVIGVQRFIPTRLDFARRLGGLLNVANQSSLPFAEASHNPQVADGILALTPEKLAALLMPHLPSPGKMETGRKK